MINITLKHLRQRYPQWLIELTGSQINIRTLHTPQSPWCLLRLFTSCSFFSMVLESRPTGSFLFDGMLILKSCTDEKT